MVLYLRYEYKAGKASQVSMPRVWLSVTDLNHLNVATVKCASNVVLPNVVFAYCCICCDCLHPAMYGRHLLIQSVYTQLRSIIVLYVTVPVELVGTVTYTRTSTVVTSNWVNTQQHPPRHAAQACQEDGGGFPELEFFIDFSTTIEQKKFCGQFGGFLFLSFQPLNPHTLAVFVENL